MKLQCILYAADLESSRKRTIRLSADERRELRHLVRVRTDPARTLTHARILLKADASADGPGWSDDQIQDACEVGHATVARVRRDFVTGSLDAALHRKPTSRHYHRALDGPQEAHLVTLACRTPPEGQTRWTLRLLTDRFIALEGTPVSDETVRRILTKTRSSRG